MNNKLYVGNLNFAVTQQDLSDHFLSAGTVLEAIVVTDRGTGDSRGFGFVTMASENEALNAIELLNGKELLGREATIKLAMERERRPERSFDDRRSRDSGGFRGNREGGGGGGGFRGHSGGGSGSSSRRGEGNGRRGGNRGGGGYRSS
jgi:cold-inducible RNA-binding protein